MGVGLVLVFAAAIFVFVFHDTFLKVSYENALEIKVPIPPVRDRDRAVATDVRPVCDRIGHSHVLMRQILLTVNKLATPVCHCNRLETIEFSARDIGKGRSTHRPAEPLPTAGQAGPGIRLDFSSASPFNRSRRRQWGE
jgi:hypothetical protein